MENPEKEKSRSFHTAAPENIRNNTTVQRKEYQAKLDKLQLLSPVEMLEILSIRYRMAGGKLAVFCPFHKDGKESNPSLMMNIKDGHFRCFTCGAKGGDVIAFYRAVTGDSFGSALQALVVRHD